MYDAIVIGGGFYGTAVAAYLAEQRGLSDVLLIEREKDLLKRASYNNQARVHNGYHYPRNFSTAFRSRTNLPRFVRDYSMAVTRDFTKLYAIARCNSKITAKQFVRVCRDIGARLEPAPSSLKQLFNPRQVEELFVAEEYTFDAVILAALAKQELNRARVEVNVNTRVERIELVGNTLVAECEQAGSVCRIHSRLIFNCTYSGLNRIQGVFPGVRSQLKHELAEIALMRPPKELTKLGVTVMDGPFFSLLPFPPRGLHTLSHVRYTPHLQWLDNVDTDPYARLDQYPRNTRADRMLRHAEHYMPAIADACFVESLFEIKTTLTKNESDDGRPILVEHDPALPNCFSILGSKIDNIYDVLEKLDSQPLCDRPPRRVMGV
jgi:glycine/D-amino acid oxidase-like deaminating enzyme